MLNTYLLESYLTSLYRLQLLLFCQGRAQQEILSSKFLNLTEDQNTLINTALSKSSWEASEVGTATRLHSLIVRATVLLFATFEV